MRKKIEQIVKHLMKQGLTKKEALAICIDDEGEHRC